jgi:L-histidine Nalpha-methyltransferase / hercynylcysteine S-oxide synthase
MVWLLSVHSDRANFCIGLHLVSKPSFSFSTNPAEYASQPAPTLSEWKQLWAAWDTVTQQMLPEEELIAKPIKLRNACIFYLGHIPTFLDIHLSRATGESPTEPKSFQLIFERGIDPDVDNPELCHSHSEIPDEWPPLEEVLMFQNSVRERTESLYQSDAVEKNRKLASALWLGFEHEAMHLETLLYMLIQSERVLPPPGAVTPDFKALARQSNTLAVENKWFTIPASDISIGVNDTAGEDGHSQHFGWDNEKPCRSVKVESFKAKARPITNGEYAEFLAKTGTAGTPASWCEVRHSKENTTESTKRDSVLNGNAHEFHDVVEGKYVRTVYGTVPLQHAWNWPVMASYDELARCAQWMGGRIPTMEETRSIYNFVEYGKELGFEKALGNTIPAVNG